MKCYTHIHTQLHFPGVGCLIFSPVGSMRHITTKNESFLRLRDRRKNKMSSDYDYTQFFNQPNFLFTDIYGDMSSALGQQNNSPLQYR